MMLWPQHVGPSHFPGAAQRSPGPRAAWLKRLPLDPGFASRHGEVALMALN